MSIRHNLLPLTLVVGVGLVTGNYIFRPEIDDLERKKKKRGGLLEIPASPEEKPGKENTGSDAGKVADTARDERSTPSMKTVAEDMAGGKEKTSGDGKTLPLFLQPGDDRKR